MSKWIDKLDDGTYDIEIADEDACDHMYNEVCCWDKSPFLGDYPNDEDCQTCEFFMDENGNKRKKEGE